MKSVKSLIDRRQEIEQQLHAIAMRQPPSQTVKSPDGHLVIHSIAPAPASVRGLDDLVAQFHIERTGRAHMAVSVTAQPHKGAGVAFGQAVFSHHASYGLAFDLWG